MLETFEVYVRNIPDVCLEEFLAREVHLLGECFKNAYNCIWKVVANSFLPHNAAFLCPHVTYGRFFLNPNK